MSTTSKRSRRLWLPLAVLLAASPAAAEPLTLQQLDALATHVECLGECALQDAVDVQPCREACGPADPAWDKDGVPGIDANDLDLANLEVADAGQGTELCYRDEGRIVVPAALCPGELCEAVPLCSDDDCARPAADRPRACPDVVCDARPARTPEDCADGDGDGIPAWLEAATGGDDGEALVPCGGDADCGFSTACLYDADVGAAHCQARACPDGTCTAFHLELVAADDQQVLVHLFYDHSPVPATMLDLHVRYDRSALVLADARPLPNLTAFGKELAVSHELEGLVRLVVLDRTSRDPIRVGPLVELVFTRLSDGPTAVSFSGDDDLQAEAIAPLQGDPERQAELTDDELWGEPVEVTGLDDESLERLLLWYTFDDEDSPLTVSRVPTGEQLCERVPACKHEPDAEQRAVLVARLSALQAGAVAASGSTQGVSRGGLYLDGGADHLRLPVQVLDPPEATAQSFTFSTWFYAEGPSDDELPTSPQLLYAHHGPNERTGFGLVLDPNELGGMDLSFFRGDALHPGALTRVPVGEALPLRAWHHVAFSLDAALGVTLLYLDGLPVASYDFPPSPPPVACPAFSSGVNVLLHEEGDLVGGRGPEVAYVSVRRSGLFHVERLDLNGLTSTPVLSDGRHRFQDPDYLPILDKVAYSANVGGETEIWVASGDGSEPRQVTVGFGDTARGIFARRPRWAPDGSGLLFESNVYSVPDEHNLDLGYQLYLIGWDAVNNEPAVELPDGSTASELDYEQHLAMQFLDAHQVTRGDGHHTDARWYAGRGDGESRGDVVFNWADELWRAGQVRRVRLPDNLLEAAPEEVPGLGGPETEKRLLAAANRRVRVGPRIEDHPHLLFERARADYAPSGQFSVSANMSGNAATVVVSHAPAGYEPLCWDVNANHLPPDRDGREADEDRNGDGRFDVADCYPAEALDLFVAYDSRVWDARVEPEDAEAAAEDTVLRLEAEGGVDKSLRLTALETSAGALLRVEVRSPRNGLPLPPGVVARLTFDRVRPDAPEVPFSGITRTRAIELFMDDLTDPAPPEPVTLTDVVDRVDAAAFSPEGDRLLLAGISFARPVLLRTRNLLTTSGAEQLLTSPIRMRGLSWTREQRYFACNWVGGTQHPQSKLAIAGLRGGLDDLKVFSGIRDPDSIRSEAERGLEVLDVEERRVAEQGLPTCSVSHTECPPYHLCLEGVCRMIECDPEDPYSCAETGGRCTLRALSVEQENPGDAGFSWVCKADCAVDPQCFTEACENGPCRFCDDDGACIECRVAVQDFGAFTIENLEGCPDRNSFWCEDGACQTECYAIRDDESVYVCDPTLEYCDSGRCVSFDWDWWDLAPSSLGGLSETIYEDIPGAIRTVAVGELTTIEVQAYGRGDYLHPPELLVEGQVSIGGETLYGGEWFTVGRIRVDHRTPQEAARPYLLQVPYPVSDLRLRLLNAPYDNVDSSATGLGAWDKDFCLDDAAASGGEEPALAQCYHRPPGSVFHLGYPLEIGYEDLVDGCLADGLGPECPRADDPLRPYLEGGSPAVVVLGVRVAGASATIERNEVCSYEGTLQPLEPGTGRRRKLFYGDIRRERSNEAADFCARQPEACADETPLLDFTAVSEGAYALLNCNYRDSASPAAATVEYVVPPWVQDMEAGAVRENRNSCLVEIDDLRREHCYEYTGGDVSLDPLDAPMELHQTLEFTLTRAFGHDRGFTSVPLPGRRVQVDINDLQGRLVLSNGHETLTLDGNGPTFSRFEGELPIGRRYEVTVVRQPADGTLCVPDPETARGAMVVEGITVTITCGPVHPVRGTLEGLAGDRVSLRVESSAYVAGGRVRGATRQTFDLSQNGDFALPLHLPTGASWSVTVASQPRVPTQLCEIANDHGEVGIRGVAGVNVTCEVVAPRLLGGRVRRLQGGGLEVANSATGETVALEADGEFEFEQRVMPGTRLEVTVPTQPPEPPQQCVAAGVPETMPNRDFLDVVVSCAEVPTYQVVVTVTAVAGTGLTLLLNDTEELEIGRDGRYAFETELLTGGWYEVTVLTQPSEPDQECQVAFGSGEVGDVDVDDIQVICGLSAPEGAEERYYIGGVVTGLVGTGLYLNLDTALEFFDPDEGGGGEGEGEGEGEAAAAATPPPPGQSMQIRGVGRYHFPTPVEDGMYYRVWIKALPDMRQPDSDEPVPQPCVFVDEDGEPFIPLQAEPPDWDNPFVIEPPAPPEDEDEECDEEEEDCDDGPSDEEQDAAQRLHAAMDFVIEGRINGANVRNVNLDCGASGSMLLDVSPAAPDRGAKALLYRDADGRLVGKSCRAAAQGPMVLVPRRGAHCRPPEDVVPSALAEGDHTLFLWVDSQGGGAPGSARYEPGDLSFRVTYAQTPTDISLAVTEAQLVAAVGEPVTVRGVGIPGHASVTCYWTVPTGERPAVPVSGSLATSTRFCHPEGDACWTERNGQMETTTETNGPLPPIWQYDVTCWVDRGGPYGSPNGILDGPDRVGFTPAVSVDGPGLVGSQVTVTVEVP